MSRFLSASGCALVLLISDRPCTGQALVPFGPEFRVNTNTTGQEYGASVAVSGTGEFVVVWTGPDDATTGILGRRFAASGAPLSGEFRVNTYTSGTQISAAVARSAAGGFVVVWRGNGQGDDLGIFGQRYDASGAAQGQEFRVNTFTTQNQKYPRIGMNAAGDFVVAWQSQNQASATSGYDIYAQRYNAGGVPQAGEFLVNTTTTSTQMTGSVAFGANQFVIGYDGYLPSDATGVGARLYNAFGDPFGTGFQVNTYTTNTQGASSAAMTPAGDFLVAWSSGLEDGAGNGVFAQRFSAGGAALNAPFRVNATTTGNESGPVAATEGARFVVVWRSNQVTANAYDVFVRTVSLSGAPTGGELRVNTFTTGIQTGAKVAAGPTGNFVVVWESNNQESATSGVDLYARLLRPSGDVDGNGVLNVNDVFYLINFLFAGGPDPVGPANPDGVGGTDVADVFYVINFLFAGGPAPV